MDREMTSKTAEVYRKMRRFHTALMIGVLLLLCVMIPVGLPAAAEETLTVHTAEELTETVRAAKQDITVRLDFPEPLKKVELTTGSDKAVITLIGNGADIGVLYLQEGTYVLRETEAKRIDLYGRKRKVHVTLAEDSTAREVYLATDEPRQMKKLPVSEITFVNQGRITGAGIQISTAGSATVTVINDGEIIGDIGLKGSDYWYDGNGRIMQAGKRRIINNGKIIGVMGPGVAWFAGKNTDFSISGSGVVEGVQGVALYGDDQGGKFSFDQEVRTICGELNEHPAYAATVYEHFSRRTDNLSAEQIAADYMKSVMSEHIGGFSEIADYPGYPLLLGRRVLLLGEEIERCTTSFSVSGSFYGENGCMLLPDAANLTGKIQMNAVFSEDTPRKYVWPYCPKGKFLKESDAETILKASLKKYPWCADGEEWRIQLNRQDEQGGYVYVAGNSKCGPARYVMTLGKDGTVSTENLRYYTSDTYRTGGFQSMAVLYGSNKSTILLDEDVTLAANLRAEYSPLIMDGQGHRFGSNQFQLVMMKPGNQLVFREFASTGPIEISTKRRSLTQIENILSLNGGVKIMGEGTVELSNVSIQQGGSGYASGNNSSRAICVMDPAQAVLHSSVQLSQGSTIELKSYGKKCEAQVDCDYDNAAIECSQNGSVLFSGNGKGSGRMEITLREGTPKSEVTADTDTISVTFTGWQKPGSGKCRITGRQRVVEIHSSVHNETLKASLRLESVITEGIKLELDWEQNTPAPENIDEAMKVIRKRFPNLDFSKAVDADGNPVRCEYHLIVRVNDLNNTTQITFTEGDPATWHTW